MKNGPVKAIKQCYIFTMISIFRYRIENYGSIQELVLNLWNIGLTKKFIYKLHKWEILLIFVHLIKDKNIKDRLKYIDKSFQYKSV